MSLLATDLETSDFQNHGFSYRIARSLAAASALAYLERSFLESNLASYQLKLVDYFTMAESETQVFVAEDEQNLILSFRGTESLRDWLQNLQFLQRDHPLGGEVHIGFHKALLSVWSKLAPLLNESSRKGKRLFITGHSLGGALATLAAAQMAIEGTSDQIHAIYTFGQPLVGDRRFTPPFNSIFRNRFWRFRNHNDLVTRIPPRGFYQHVQDRIKFDRDGQVMD